MKNGRKNEKGFETNSAERRDFHAVDVFGLCDSLPCIVYHQRIPQNRGKCNIADFRFVLKAFLDGALLALSLFFREDGDKGDK